MAKYPLQHIRQLVERGLKASVTVLKGGKMTDAQNWNVRYLQNGDPQLERTRLLPSMHDALIAACALRPSHTVRSLWGGRTTRGSTPMRSRNGAQRT